MKNAFEAGASKPVTVNTPDLSDLTKAINAAKGAVDDAKAKLADNTKVMKQVAAFSGASKTKTDSSKKQNQYTGKQFDSAMGTLY